MPHGAQSWNDGTTVRLWPPHGNGFLPAGQRKYGPLPPRVEEAFFMLAGLCPRARLGHWQANGQAYGLATALACVCPQGMARGPA